MNRSCVKRGVDIVVGATGLAAVAPVLGAAALAVKADSPGPVLFSQERVGQGGREFRLFKLRTMETRRASGPSITVAGDSRVTRVGRILRKYKLDELPQLYNVLRGDMSLVGPRPEVRRYVRKFATDYEIIHRVRPGLTDEASVVYRNEEAVLAAAEDPEREYVETILPHKLRMARRYVEEATLMDDLRLIGRTVLAVVGG